MGKKDRFGGVEFQDVDLDLFRDEENDIGGRGADPLDNLPPAKKNLVIFFVIDVSESMKGEKAKALNNAMRELLPQLIGVGESNTNVSVAVLTFGSGCEWLTVEPELIEAYQDWYDIVPEGVTDLGEALLELNAKMSRKSFLQSTNLSYAPVVFLMTDGYPTDNYKAGMEQIKQNRWFQNGIKIALAIGSNADLEVLEEFTGDKDFVVSVCNGEQLAKMIKAVSVSSVQIGSQSMPITERIEELTEEKVSGLKQEKMKEELTEIRQDIMGYDEVGLDELDYESGW